MMCICVGFYRFLPVFLMKKRLATVYAQTTITHVASEVVVGSRKEKAGSP